LIETDDFNGVDSSNLKVTLKLVGAVDIGYSKTDDRKAVAVITVLEYPSMKVVYEDSHNEI
jgi:deoxyinosine 3'endonuclease (endonuclease V)